MRMGRDLTKVQDPCFAATRWSIVLNARGNDSPESRCALEELCRIYWQPVYRYVRRNVTTSQDAEDLTQDFFSKLLEKEWLRAVKREKGKFRSFLLVSLKHFLANQRDRERAQKRGGGQHITHFEARALPGREPLEVADVSTAAREFERQWAVALLDRVVLLLEAEMNAAGKQRLFDALKIFLTAGRGALPYAEVAATLGMSQGAVKVAAHRLRARYREALRNEIAQTVATPAQIEEEIQALFAAFG